MRKHMLALPVLVALLAGSAVGVTAQEETSSASPPTYEAVFLQADVTDDGHGVLVVGVDPQGNERQIATFEGAWSAYWIGDGYLAPMGAVTPSGLLAIPAEDGQPMMRWQLYDLRAPGLAPSVIPDIKPIDIERFPLTPYFRADTGPGVFVGPGERIAIPWVVGVPPGCQECESDWYVTFVEGRSGTTRTVDLGEVSLLPEWVADGSGVIVVPEWTYEGDGQALTVAFGDILADAPRSILRPDGTVIAAGDAESVPSCGSRLASGARLEITIGGQPEDPARIEVRDPEGNTKPLPGPARLSFACSAPDGSAIAGQIDPRFSEAATASRAISTVGASERGPWSEVEGTFAGWLEVE